MKPMDKWRKCLFPRNPLSTHEKILPIILSNILLTIFLDPFLKNTREVLTKFEILINYTKNNIVFQVGVLAYCNLFYGTSNVLEIIH